MMGIWDLRPADAARYASAMKHKRFITAITATICLTLSASAADEPLEPGKEVPAVKSIDTDNKTFDVTAYLKQGTTLVFFFPKANTGG